MFKLDMILLTSAFVRAKYLTEPTSQILSSTAICTSRDFSKNIQAHSSALIYQPMLPLFTFDV